LNKFIREAFVGPFLFSLNSKVTIDCRRNWQLFRVIKVVLASGKKSALRRPSNNISILQISCNNSGLTKGLHQPKGVLLIGPFRGNIHWISLIKLLQ
jgi:hypothetical protein